jgi:hypothetical protein
LSSKSRKFSDALFSFHGIEEGWKVFNETDLRAKYMVVILEKKNSGLIW